MGFILSKFRKTKPSIKDNLDKIDKELRGIARFQIDTEIQQKRIITKLTILAFIVYIVCLILYYFFAPMQKWTALQYAYSSLPFVIFPVTIYYLRAVLGWWYQRKIVQNREISLELKKEKERLLEEVMDKETFKVAKEILEKYAPSHLLPKYLADAQRASPAIQTPTTRQGPGGRMSMGNMEFNEGLRRRQMAQSTPLAGRQSFGPQGQSGRFQGPPGQFVRMPYRPQAAIMAPPGSRPMGPQNTPSSSMRPSYSSVPTGLTPMRFMMPQPPSNPVVHNRKTGWMDKLVDYVVGDGPTHRFALICRYCATHNGLATPEDFPYTGYRCIYCRQYNPPREQRPSAHTLPRNTVLIEEMESTLKSETSGVSEEESENENKCDGDSEIAEMTQEEGTKDTTNVTSVNDSLIELSTSTTDLSQGSNDPLLISGNVGTTKQGGEEDETTRGNETPIPIQKSDEKEIGNIEFIDNSEEDMKDEHKEDTV